MDLEVRWSRPALDDVGEIVAFIAERSPDTAQRVGDAILRHARILATFPEIGPAYREEASGPIREIMYKNYRVFYQVRGEPKRVDILSVRHGSRREPIDLE